MKDGHDPRDWLGFLNRKCFEAGEPPTIEGKQLAKWIWYGAYKQNPARTALYEAVKEYKPEYFAAVVKGKLEFWSDYHSGGPGFVSSNETERLFRHPELRRYFGALSIGERKELKMKLRPFLEDKDCRAVLIQNPYKFKTEIETE